MPRWERHGSGMRFVSTWDFRQSRGVTFALALAAVCMLTGPESRAENECGLPEGEVVCSPSTYDPADGNIFYSHDEHGQDDTSGDFSIRLTEDLSITYDHERPGSDVYVHPDDDTRSNGAVWIAPGEFGEYTGDVSLSSSADVTSNAQGLYAGHYGKSGALRMEISGGDFTTMGSLSHAIHGFRPGGSAGALDIVVRDASIDTAGFGVNGIRGWHEGEGDVALTARDLTIDTDGFGANGILGWHQGKGDVALTARNLTIDTDGFAAAGILGWHQGKGDVALTARDLAIDTAGENAAGIYVYHLNEGKLALTARDLAIDTAGKSAGGISGWHQGKGEMALTTQGLDITTSGDGAYGISGLHQGEGEVALTARALDITTSGDGAYGVFGWHLGSGEVNITAQGIAITTSGDDAYGIYSLHQGEGDIGLEVHDVAIDTTGGNAHGVYAEHLGTGGLSLDVRGASVATMGAEADGVVSDYGGSGSAHIMIGGGSVHAAGVGASGVRMGRLAEDGTISLAAPVGEDGYRKQSVVVNAPVTGGTGENAAGVFLAGGGQVAIGPKGTLGAASQVAILASGGAPKLRVEMDLDERRVAEVLRGGAIRNEGGETTLVVNGVTLHEGATGATGATVARGARDLTVSASETVQGRTFTPQDFIETYAPRAAVYEALPGFLLRLDGGSPSGRRVARSGSPLWARISGGRGSYEPRHASAGANYDFRRFAAEAGIDFSLGGNLAGSFSLRRSQGSADVKSPYGAGDIDAKGMGGAVGLSWSGPGAYYWRGRFALMDYDVDVSSRKRGGLARDIDANGHYAGFEAGRLIAYGEKMTFTPRAWAASRSISAGGFTDALGSRVSLSKSTRYTGGVGLSAGTARTLGGGALTLRASADVERALGGAETSTSVSGETLESEAPATRVLLGLGGSWRKGRFALGAQVAVGGPGSDDTEHSGRVDFIWKF